MNKLKQEQLEQTYWEFMNLFFDNTSSLENLDRFISKDIMGFGTTIEEKILNLKQAKDLIQLGRDQQSPLSDFIFEKKSLSQKVIPNNDVAIYLHEIDLSYKLNESINLLPLRVSTVLVYQKDVWKVTHWHASAGAETEEGDTWHVDELELKNKKLQDLVDMRTAELEQSIANLKAAQDQLIQSEKMASLGELTAGIAHEIKNPLNFVNNFADLSGELIDEMNEEIDEGHYEEVKAIANDVKQNLEKISFHGNRADSIVKGMLQHSSTGSGEKELVDLNSLTDEYFRLAYHGLRAKDKSFNATLETNYDEAIKPIAIVPQDIGRVILNVFTNAFYAVDDKMKSQATKQNSDYQPTVSVVTKRHEHSIDILVTDNGNGIPENSVNRIFEPFFTTKPTGKGTGLGLSMSYDIIKAHKGELRVDTKPGEFTEFKITLPITGLKI